MTSTLVVGTNTYITLTEANTYLGDSIRAQAWSFLPSDTRNKALLTAFRIIERQVWEGEATGSIAFPRTGLTDCDEVAVSSATVPQLVKDAQAEIAYDLTQDNNLETTGGIGSNVKRARAGSAEVEFFTSTGGASGTGSARFQPHIMELIGCFLEGSNIGGIAPIAPGTSVESQTDAGDGYCVSEGYQ